MDYVQLQPRWPKTRAAEELKLKVVCILHSPRLNFEFHGRAMYSNSLLLFLLVPTTFNKYIQCKGLYLPIIK